ncbi:hypothetical protein AB8Z38_04845 [Bradyrhizobium sp. LLZ17]|uniref:Uncharacterized protein n=1 Tax=Bradyrhizobium sp. LLZ17 TaxID=3239388 RepID=A0AB39XLU2_9BRAD
MAAKLTTYDPADDLQTNEAFAVFMEEALKTEDEAYVSHARRVVARARAARQNR